MTTSRFVPVVLALIAVSATAHEGMHGPGAEFDANQDAKLSVEEYTTYLKSSKQDVAAAGGMFAKLDRDESGFLSSAEFIAGLPKTPADSKKQ